MPSKGMRSVYFAPPTPKHLSSVPSSPYNSSPLWRNRPMTPLFSFSESMITETIYIAEEKINKWNSETSSYAKVTSLFHENRREAKEYIKSVNDLQRAMHFLLTENPSSNKLVHCQKLMQIAMKRLEKEFYQILSTNRDHFDPESISTRSSITSQRSRSSTYSDCYDDASEDEIQVAGNSISEVERDSALAMSDLKSIADCMISSGYGKECVKIYRTIRKSIVDEGLYSLGVEHLSSNKVQKLDYEIMELKHYHWVKAVKIAVRTLFSGERILCDEVFCTSDSIRESCFAEISREGAMNLFAFPELFLKSKKSPEKIFRILDLYHSISELWPEIESIFSFESTNNVRTQALSSLHLLGESVRTMLSEFESTIQKDSSKSPVPGGGIHPITQYGMNFICQLADYSIILSNIIEDWPLSVQTPMPESYFDSLNSDDNPMSALSVRLAWLVLVVICKLDGKAELYKDVSLAYLFLANNLQFIISKVRTSNLEFLLGDDWISKHEIKVKQYAMSYQRLGWDKVLSVLPVDPTVTLSPEEAKDCLEKFTSAFETAYHTQSSWVVPDSKLRDEIKVSICSQLLPPYRAFFHKYRVTLRGAERYLESSVKFSPDDLGNYLSDLFYGNVISGSYTPTVTSTPSPSRHSISSRLAKLKSEFKPFSGSSTPTVTSTPSPSRFSSRVAKLKSEFNPFSGSSTPSISSTPSPSRHSISSRVAKLKSEFNPFSGSSSPTVTSTPSPSRHSISSRVAKLKSEFKPKRWFSF